MGLFKNMKIGQKLISGFIVVAIFTGIIGIIGITNLESSSNSGTELYENMTIPISDIAQMSREFQRIRVNVRDAILADDEQTIKVKVDKITELWTNYDKYEQEFSAKILSSDMKEKYSTLIIQRKDYVRSLEPVIELAQTNKDDEAAALLTEKSISGVASRAMQDTIDEIINMKIADAKTKAHINTEKANTGSLLMIIVIGSSMVLSVIIGVAISGTISRPMRKLTAVADLVALGDVSVNVTADSRDEIGMLMDSFDKMVVNIKEQASIAERMSNGDFSMNIVPKSDNDVLLKSMNLMQNNLKSLVYETSVLTNESVKGNFETRGTTEKFNGGYKEIVLGINSTLDTIIEKIFWYESILDAVPFPVSVTDLNMKWTFINTSTEKLVGIKRKDVMGLHCSNWNANICKTENCGVECLRNNKSQTTFEQNNSNFQVNLEFLNNANGEKIGHIEVIQDISAIVKSGDYQKIEIERLSENLRLLSLGNLELDLNVADGDSYTILERENFIKINQNLKVVKESINRLVTDANMLSIAAVEGKLSTRADASKHGGDFAKVVDGVNKTLDAVVGPLQISANYVDKISRGDIPPKITANYNGDFNDIKNNLNSCIDAVNLLVSDANMLSIAAVEGKLSTRADASKHGGDFAKVVDGVNKTLDAVVEPINIASEYVKKLANGADVNNITGTYNGDYGILITNLNLIKDSLYLLLNESGELANNAINGNLSYRADVSKLKGGYAGIINGVNKTLDAVIMPVQEAASVLKEMSEGNLQVRVNGNYMGDHADIKNALNDTLDTLSTCIRDISYILKEISNFNLDLSINHEYKGDFSQIKDSLNLIVKSLNNVLDDVNDATVQVAIGSRQVSDSSVALSEGATNQASSIEEFTASIEEIASQTRNNAGNADRAKNIAENAKVNAINGNEEMQQMLKSMSEINDSSNNISKIIKVIDEIAFQTNILALNAAVEAARAGQHGKGFAVVAEEVRNLAARSAKAAQETTDLIEGSIIKVNDGIQIADKTAKALDIIVSEVAEVANLVSDIAVASNEQSIGVGQINQGIMQISEVVQTTSSTSAETAAASEELSSQAEMLKLQVSKFKLRKQDKPLRFSDTQELPPEVLEMLANMNKPNNKQIIQKKGEIKKIDLSDNEFSKY